MTTKTLAAFFTDKTLVIPSYQRDYAWEKSNVDDLWEDIEEALQVHGGHYIGTFILCQTSPEGPLSVVDGQQRLITLTMLLDALIAVLSNQALLPYYRYRYIKDPTSGRKLTLQGDNDDFFIRLLDGQNPPAGSDAQERLANNYRWIGDRVKVLVQQGGQTLIENWLKCLDKLEVLEFIQSDEGKAIRMFQSVNDRGVLLTRMDIAKSLLVYYSNRFLKGALDRDIAHQFGLAFHSFSRLKRLAHEKGYEVQLVNREAFSEDDVLRYHYFAFEPSGFNFQAPVVVDDYTASADKILKDFLKPALKALRNDPVALHQFIWAYTQDLAAFFGAFEALLRLTRTDLPTYLLFVVQSLSTILCPLVIRLHMLGRLSAHGSSDPRSLQEVIEMVDLRVFKLRGTDPTVDVFNVTRNLHVCSDDLVVVALKQFCQRFMPDATMGARLQNEAVFRNPGLPRMLMHIESEARTAAGMPNLTLNQLVTLTGGGLSVEHILPQEPKFGLRCYGFSTSEEYELYNHRIGNLVLLEQSLNSRCSNRKVEDKMADPTLYSHSVLHAVHALAANHAPPNPVFGRNSIDARSTTLAQTIMQRWSI